MARDDLRRLAAIEPLPLFSDRPVDKASQFNFEALAATMIGMLCRRANPTPFVFLVDGKWGTGKTSLMKTVIAALQPAAGADLIADLIAGAALKPDDPLVGLVEGSVMRWAPLRVLESASESSWKGVKEKEGKRPGKLSRMTEDQREAWYRLRWLGNLVDQKNNGRFAQPTSGKANAIVNFYSRFRPIRTVFFNAWKYRGEGEIFPALAHEMLAAMRRDGWLARFQAVVQEVGSADWREAVAKLAESVPYVGGALGEVVRPPQWLSDVALYDRARPFLQGLATAWATTWGLKADSKPRRLLGMLRDDIRHVGAHLRGLRMATEPAHGTLPGIVAVFIDDLDRCPSEHVSEVVKAINLLVDLEECAFILGADRERVAEALRRGDEGESPLSAYGDQFLGKIVQLHLVLPQSEATGMLEYVEQLLREVNDAKRRTKPKPNSEFPLWELWNHRNLLVIGAPSNPRRVKEVLNQAVARLSLLRIVPERGGLEASKVTALLKYLLVCLPLPRRLRTNRRFLLDLERLALEEPASSKSREMDADIREVLLAEEARGVLSDGAAVAAAVTGIVEGDQDAADLVAWVSREDPNVWSRIFAVFRWPPDGGGKPVRIEPYLETFATLGPPVGTGPGEAEVKKEVAELRIERDRAEEATQREVQDLVPHLRGLLQVLKGVEESDRRGVIARFLEHLSGHKRGWSGTRAAALKEALRTEVLVAEEAQRVADRAQQVLAQAFDDKAVARHEAAMNLALAIRDGAVDRAGDLEGVDPRDADPFEQEGWKKAEADRLTDQLEELRKKLRGSERVRDLIRTNMLGEDSSLEEMLTILMTDQERRLTGNEDALWVIDRVGPTFGAFRPQTDEPSWLLVPGGAFIAGDVVEDDERPVRLERTADPCWVARDPVTVDEFLAFLKAQYKRAATRDERSLEYDLSNDLWKNLPGAKGALGARRAPVNWEAQIGESDRPVVGISWFEAAAYCLWKNGVTSNVEGWGGSYRLPTEGEWEKAARGLLGRRWPSGCAWRPELVVCSEGGSPQGAPAVVSVNANTSQFGARGVAGNVWEWTQTAWEDRGFGPVVDSSQFERGDRISVRGGSFLNDRHRVRDAYRDRSGAGSGYDLVGFRCVRDVI